MSTVQYTRTYLDFYAKEAVVDENVFVKAAPERAFPPALAEVRHKLPEPFWDGHDTHMRVYWKAWELAFRNLKRVHAANGFCAPYIDAAFNDCLFQWDSCFMLLFARYGVRGFDFQGTLDNFYRKQHADGFICREIQEWDGHDRFHRFDPTSTGPNIFPWCEWEYYLTHHDPARLAKVFPPLLALHKWMKAHRTWPDGSYWSNGLACGMDNQPRTLLGDNPWVSHSFSAWIDATAQAVMSANTLVCMAEALGPPHAHRPEIADLRREAAHLTRYITQHMWDEQQGCYADRRLHMSMAAAAIAGRSGAYETATRHPTAPAHPPAPASAAASGAATSCSASGGSTGAAEPGGASRSRTGTSSSSSSLASVASSAAASAALSAPVAAATNVLSPVRTIGAYWTLLAGVVPPERLDRFLQPLDDPALFNRPVRVPSLSADHPQYLATGGYWLGGTWPSTTYMVLRGLTAVGRHDVAADIGANYAQAVATCYAATGTIWENMSPERPQPGDPAKGDFVGWGGLGPIAILFEYVFGIRADVPTGTLTWDIRQLEGHGVLRYPFGDQGVLHLQVASRRSAEENPRVYVRSTVPLKLVLQWGKTCNPEGGVRVDRSGTPLGPLHQRTIELRANMTVNESEGPPAYTPTHALRRLVVPDRPSDSPKGADPISLEEGNQAAAPTAHGK